MRKRTLINNFLISCLFILTDMSIADSNNTSDSKGSFLLAGTPYWAKPGAYDPAYLPGPSYYPWPSGGRADMQTWYTCNNFCRSQCSSLPPEEENNCWTNCYYNCSQFRR